MHASASRIPNHRLAAIAAGFIFALHLPLGNPSDASYVQPLLDHVQQAIARVATAPRPAIHSLAGDLAFNDASLREALHQQGILTVGIPHTVDPLPPSPTPEDVLRLLSEGACREHGPHARCTSPTRVDTADPWSNASWPACCAVAPRALTYKGQRSAIVQTGMAVMAHNAATLVRIHEYCLSKRARKFRRRLRLRCRKVNEFNASN